MAISTPRQFLICYDIADPKRLARVHKYLSARAFPVQYSVFSVRTTARRVDAMLDDLNRIINSREDDLRAYTLSDRTKHTSLGRQILPEGAAVIEDSQGLLDGLTVWATAEKSNLTAF